MSLTDDAITLGIRDFRLKRKAAAEDISAEAARKLDALQARRIEQGRRFRDLVMPISPDVADVANTGIRANKVASVRAAIDSREYETDHKLDVATAALLGDLMG